MRCLINNDPWRGNDMKIKFWIVVFIVFYAVHANAFSFAGAKRILERDIYNTLERRVTLYCGCEYSEKKIVDHDSCGYIPDWRFYSRSNRIEWEHIVPASWFGRDLQCWKDHKEVCPKAGNGRKCCGKVDEGYKTLEADMHNLFPSIGQINAIRSNHAYGVVEGEDRKFGVCDWEFQAGDSIYGIDATVEPAPQVRGEIARTMLYMNMKYYSLYDKLLISDFNTYMILSTWNHADPPDSWEFERNRLIKNIQGNSNPYIDIWEK